MKYRSFEEARKFVHSLKLKNVPDWEEGARKLQEICSRAINGFEKYYHYDEED